MAARGKAARKEPAGQATSQASDRRPSGAGLASRRRFLARIRRAATYAFALIALALGIGMVGYHEFGELSWLDAFHQAALLLSGMGPVADLYSTAGKVFDSVYALFCGVILLVATGLLFAPVIHRILHRFHIEDAGER